MTGFGKLVFSLLLALSGTLTYFAFSYNGASGQSDETASALSATSSTVNVLASSTSSGAKDEASSTVSFSEFVKKEGVYTCQVSTNLDAPLGTGEISFNASKLRGVFHFNSIGGVSSSTYFIISNKTLYSWFEDGMSSSSSHGVKIRNTVGVSEVTDNVVTRFSLKDITEYSCEKSDLSDSYFALPTSVTFESK